MGLAKLHCGATPPSVMVLFLRRSIYFDELEPLSLQEIRRDFQAEAERKEFEAELKRKEKEKAMSREQQEYGKYTTTIISFVCLPHVLRLLHFRHRIKALLMPSTNDYLYYLKFDLTN